MEREVEVDASCCGLDFFRLGCFLDVLGLQQTMLRLLGRLDEKGSEA